MKKQKESFDAIRQIMAPPVPPKRKIGFRIDEKRAQYRARESIGRTVNR